MTFYFFIKQMEGKFEVLKINPDYLIGKHGQHKIINKTTHKIVKERLGTHDYYTVYIPKCGQLLKHQVVIDQFKPHEFKPGYQVDHINRDHHNNNINNLRYVSQRDNLKNKTGWGEHKYVYVDELPQEAKRVEEYNKYTFNELWYDNGIFYQKAVDKFRCLEVLDEIKRKQTKKGLKEYIYKYVYAEDKNNKQRKIYIKKFTKSNL